MYKFMNSYGQESNIHKFNVKKRRQTKHVIIEVLEVLDRIYLNYRPVTAYVSPQLICAELRENLQAVKDALVYIEKDLNVVEKSRALSTDNSAPNYRLLKTRELYKINRHSTDKDYKKIMEFGDA